MSFHDLFCSKGGHGLPKIVRACNSDTTKTLVCSWPQCEGTVRHAKHWVVLTCPKLHLPFSFNCEKVKHEMSRRAGLSALFHIRAITLTQQLQHRDQLSGRNRNRRLYTSSFSQGRNRVSYGLFRRPSYFGSRLVSRSRVCCPMTMQPTIVLKGAALV
ncbi:hypothetical protein OG21DRAFT_1112824 [Imleria badia]|nr:hypothetical protein OG21DRAFT_1112824 [Imleria badia]